eukprot:Phypoly_transcript_07403.p1 GENE.Phypoly_transcript_07403~~Phypoly_transcript_07403.p1  ORF type:complete len:461 (+),score=50.87 Phypoly_transcript_07403:201-1583(+)
MGIPVTIALILLLCHTSSSLFIYVVSWNETTDPTHPTTNLTPIFLESVYATIGTYPKNITIAPMVFLSPGDIQACSLNSSINVSDSIVVLKGSVPPLFECNRHSFGSSTALTKILQARGAKGLVIAASEGYKKGRVVGFSSGVLIPVVVVAKRIIQYLVENRDAIVYMGLTSVKPPERALLQSLSRGYKAFVIFDAVLFGVLILLMGLAMSGEVHRLKKKKKWYSHRTIMIATSLASATAGFLWLVVDPMGDKGYMWWRTSIASFFYQGVFCIVNILIVRMWILFTFHRQARITKVVTIVAYILSVIIAFIAIAQGCFWYDPAMIQVYTIVDTAFYVLCGLGYVLFGKKFLVIFSKGGNASPDSHALPTKIALFVLIYVVVTYALIIIAFLAPMGKLFCALFSALVLALLFFAIFIFLFFPKIPFKSIHPSKQIAMSRKKMPPNKEGSFTHINDISSNDC